MQTTQVHHNVIYYGPGTIASVHPLGLTNVMGSLENDHITKLEGQKFFIREEYSEG